MSDLNWKLYDHNNELVGRFRYPIDAARAATFMPAGAFYKFGAQKNTLYTITQNDRDVLNSIKFPSDTLHVWFKDMAARLTNSRNTEMLRLRKGASSPKAAE
jgi:hypothetical protein